MLLFSRLLESSVAARRPSAYRQRVMHGLTTICRLGIGGCFKHSFAKVLFILCFPPLLCDRVENAVAAIKRGEFVVVMDGQDRENEGDLIMAAEKVSTRICAVVAQAFFLKLVCFT